MLSRLSVENYALIESLEQDFSSGLNIVTGETGAGKSILLGALGLIMGNRADVAALKDSARNCVVEGTFEIAGYGLEEFMADNDLDNEPTTTIRRVITPAGKSRAYVNDLPVQLPLLRELALRLIDIHSQHHNRLLSDRFFRLKTVDSMAGNSTLRASYSDAYVRLREAERRLAELRTAAEAMRRDEEYSRYQYEQLLALNLIAGEQEELEAEQRELANVEQIAAVLGQAQELLDGDEDSVLTDLKAGLQALRTIENVYIHGAALAERIQSSYLELKDVAAEIAARREGVEYNPARLAAVDERLGAIYAMQQKHRLATVEELIALRDNLGARLDSISDSDEQIASLERSTELFRQRAEEQASLLSDSRRRAAERIAPQVEAILVELGMPVARFRCEVSAGGELTPEGADEVSFMFDANDKGQLQPLEKVASGGELSRVMLALKSIMARGAKLPTIIFDEIDTGVSGRIADATGRIIASLAETMQVINITHLPQVASKGDTHFLVLKSGTGEQARTVVRKLSPDERVHEIAKMLSGSTVTDAAIKQAETLLGVE